MRGNSLVVFAVIGLLVGALAGYLTRPQAAEIKLGPISIEVQGNRPAGASGGSLTSGQVQHIAIFTVIGGLIGAGVGFAMGRRA